MKNTPHFKDFDFYLFILLKIIDPFKYALWKKLPLKKSYEKAFEKKYIIFNVFSPLLKPFQNILFTYPSPNFTYIQENKLLSL